MSTLLAASFIDEAELASHLGRSSGAEDDIERRLTDACNRSVAWMEMRAWRRLKARNYRTSGTVTTSGSTAADAATLVVSSTAGLRVGDDLLGSGLDPGTQVESITNGTTLVPSKKVRAAMASGTVITYGSKPLVLTLDEAIDARDLYLPESPLEEDNLWAAYYVEGGVRSALDLSNVQIEEATGRIALSGLYGRLSAGRYEFEARAGFEEPSSTTAGHPAEWQDLKAIQLRVAEVLFSDGTQLRGRSTTYAVGNVSLSSGEAAMPADIEQSLRRYWRAGS